MWLQSTLNRVFPLIISLAFTAGVHSQVTADFLVSNPSGCAPLSVKFSNTSAGASASAIFQWDFGNGNKSVLKNAEAVFIDPGSYSVSLTISDSGKTAKATKTIVVYKKPVVSSIQLSTLKSCAPLQVTLTANAQAGDGTIKNYLWDFGDGITQSGSTAQISHGYIVQQNPIINVSVTNNFGCQSTFENRNLQVLDSLKASFAPEKTFLCRITDAVKFLNNCTGPGAINAQWYFGDGTTSAQYSPSKVYSVKGAYDVSLVVTNAYGCRDSITKTALLNVANFSSSILPDTLLCARQGIAFRNTSKPAPTSSNWFFEKAYVNTLYSTGNDSVYNSYNNPVNDKITLVNKFGDCIDSVSKLITVNPKPIMDGFEYSVAPCGPPFSVTVTDTATGNVKWYWEWEDYHTLIGQQKQFTYQFDYPIYSNVYMTGTNAFGCSTTVGKRVTLQPIYLEIFSPETKPNDEIHSCGVLPIHFYTKSDLPVTSFTWNFGDSTRSTDSTPVHIFKNPGIYKVTVTCIFSNGCTRTVEYKSYVIRRDRAKSDFSISNTNICGNTPQTIYNLSQPAPYYYYQWDWGGAVTDYLGQNEQANQFTVQFEKEGVFTITLIGTDAICADTMVKKNYIKINPPFPKIGPRTYTCEGTRGEVTFSQTTKQAISSSWDFGDGTVQTVGAGDSLIKHIYTKTGYYKTVLTTTNGACTVKDSTGVPVLLRQFPKISANKTQVCANDEDVEVTYSNLEQNPATSVDFGGYSAAGWYFKDNVYALTSGNSVSVGSLYGLPFSLQLRNFVSGESGFYSMVRSGYFNCIDTTNIIPLKTTGPVPGFKQLIADPCKGGLTVFLQDTSKSPENVAIQKWEWYFGDGITETYPKPGIVSHKYNYPSDYYQVYLTVTDANGCHAQFLSSAVAQDYNITASFTPSATVVSPNSSIRFSNTSHSSQPDKTTYKWTFGDGSSSTNYDAEKTYTKPGKYTITLTGINGATGCSDTATIIITVKYINAAFTIDQSYTSSSNCPPVKVSFNSISSNASKITWDFGDGSKVYGLVNPAHIYTQPGKYTITLITESDNGTQYTTVDSVSIKAPSAAFSANKFSACNNQQINFKITATNTNKYVWDFGDGTVTTTADTTITHNYSTGGIYEANFIAIDTNGCSFAGKLAGKILIDTLSVALDNLPVKICSPKQIDFNPNINSIAESFSQPLRYAWNFGTGNAADTSNIKTPSYNFIKAGDYNVFLQVTSPYGCTKNAQAKISVFQGLGGIINGPREICEGETATFSGATQIAGSPRWKWLFYDGTAANQQIAPPKLYADSGIYKVQLVVDNNNCADTISTNLTVHGKPAFIINPHGINLCSGSRQTITVTGNASFSWLPATGLNTNIDNSVTAAPAANIIYTVQASSAFGCKSSDTVSVTVIQPFSMPVSKDASVCLGSSTQLSATGAFSYQWLNNPSSLNNGQISNPLATPVTTTTYTVAGTDRYRCFSDTASIKITVFPHPTVDAGSDIELLSGSSYPLKPNASNDVENWQWQPGDFLSCTTCASPVATPLSPIDYVVKVTNAAGCTATDTLKVSILCSGNKIYIPSGFTPNNDGLNDRFAIKAFGIRNVHYLRIYDRWGVLVFEKTNFGIDDRSGSWDGTYKGSLLPGGSYVYMTELECNGEKFLQKGTVTLIR